MTEQLSDAEIERRVGLIRDAITQRIPVERARHKKRVFVVSGVLAAAVAVSGATLVVQASSDVINYEVRCYDGPSLSADFVQVQSVLGVDDKGEPGRAVLDPVAACADLWHAGLIGQATPPDDPNSASFSVPELVGCTLPNGSAAGLPREGSKASVAEFCKKLGLAPWE